MAHLVGAEPAPVLFPIDDVTRGTPDMCKRYCIIMATPLSVYLF